jgi:hypothetical protein
MSHLSYKKLFTGLFVASFACGSLSACAIAKERRLTALAQRDLPGITRTALINCAGEPAWSELKGDTERLTYVSEHPDVDQNKRTTTCVANFMLRHGYVEQLHYETLAGRMVPKREACAPIISDCMLVN